jgi:hypothetical protein
VRPGAPRPNYIPRARQLTKFELVVNLKTAKAIEVENSLLLRADKVIE